MLIWRPPTERVIDREAGSTTETPRIPTHITNASSGPKGTVLGPARILRYGWLWYTCAVNRKPAMCGFRLVALAIIQLAGFGCGYKFIDYSEPIADLGSVAIQTFKNESYEPGVEFVVADALRREFLRRGAVVLVDDAIDADLVVSGVVEPIVTRARSFSTIALALEWEATLQLVVYAERSGGIRTRLDEDATLATERYLASADIEATRQNRDEAIRTMASNLAAHVHDMLYELYLP